MPIKPNTAKVTDLHTTVEPDTVDTADGPILWATVRMDYTLSGVTPVVTIRVPIPFIDGQSETERRGQALRCARQLIEHACRAAGIGSAEPETEENPFEEAIDSVAPSALQGIAQELGLAKPTRQPRGRKAPA